MAKQPIDPYLGFSEADVVRLLSPHVSDARNARMHEVLAQRLVSVGALVEDTYDPHNAAAIVRTVESFGHAAVHVIDGHGRFAPVSAITIGCDQWLDVVGWPSAAAAIDGLRARGFAVYGTTPDATMSYLDLPMDRPTIIAFGSERDGLRPETLAQMDGNVTIPMSGFSQSLNLSVSVGIVMSVLTERRRAVLGRAGDMAALQQQQLLAAWTFGSVKGAAEILRRARAAMTYG